MRALFEKRCGNVVQPATGRKAESPEPATDGGMRAANGDAGSVDGRISA